MVRRKIFGCLAPAIAVLSQAHTGERTHHNSKSYVKRNRALMSKTNPRLAVVGSTHFLQSPALKIKRVPHKGK